MILDVYTVAYNEEELLPEFLRHYAFARRIVVYDNQSGDRTAAIAAADPHVELRSLATGGKYDEGAQMDVRNNAWRESDADWVCIVDVDELVDCRPLAGLAPWEVAWRCAGRNMVGSDGQPFRTIRRYVPASLSAGLTEMRYDKVSVFCPRIAAINYAPGMHTADPSCPTLKNPRLILRHYCHLGEEWTIRRFRRCTYRMSQRNCWMGWGRQYLLSDEAIRREHRRLLAASVEDSEL
jgi:glycosyltransferase involved in cell wall biosynthesis